MYGKKTSESSLVKGSHLKTEKQELFLFIFQTYFSNEIDYINALSWRYYSTIQFISRTIGVIDIEIYRITTIAPKWNSWYGKYMKLNINNIVTIKQIVGVYADTKAVRRVGNNGFCCVPAVVSI